ncbi:MAG: hypothetical protein E6X17_03340 [Sporomusaceae bacterium]|nr:hypothetical protein [Sporomusaceae bacterium]
MHKFVRSAMIAFVGAAFAFNLMGQPVANAHSSPSRETKTTVRSYDMEDYLDMLLASGQYDKYRKFSRIALPDAYARHADRWTGDPVRIVYGNPLAAARADSYQYGFDGNADGFSLMSRGTTRAVVKIVHAGSDYYAQMQKNSAGNWYIATVYKAK